MFIYKGGETAKKGTYWESEQNKKIVLDNDGVLPGTGKAVYFKLPESYLLIVAILAGLGLSMAMPYGVGFMVFAFLIALTTALYAAGFATIKLLKEMFGRTATFGYTPTTAYMTGKKTKKVRKDINEEATQKRTE
jgi:hypothetical protein